ncbi:DNA-directed RNA polymerase specialized sigma subunit, sigma24 homolog [Solibacillus silvestris StLB046]|uniref:RNA polymerase sigma factor n=1 Tax=Solibacillus silvestris (strain StLB046) TaxID=1002809 RepID=F2FAJ1_SOLSS|nr:sigma-70 family RNA polymerase sigma factor [Solibacillus silvestris]BAK16758.1 DNA-directed RNA polymerase specialized sigma subunit, sigma24 homolog [Solibacillus silvestris StLB046]
MELKQSELDAITSNPLEAIVEIMDTYGTEIKRFVYMYLKNEADTEDVTQEVFVAVYQNIHTFKGKSSLKSWIYSIAANKCKNHLKRNRLRHFNLIERLTRQQSSVSSKQEDLSELYLQNSLNKGLFEKVMDLPIKYREVVILYYYKELSIKEICAILNEKESTLQSRLLRSRNKLKDSILNEVGGTIHG